MIVTVALMDITDSTDPRRLDIKQVVKYSLARPQNSKTLVSP